MPIHLFTLDLILCIFLPSKDITSHRYFSSFPSPITSFPVNISSTFSIPDSSSSIFISFHLSTTYQWSKSDIITCPFNVNQYCHNHLTHHHDHNQHIRTSPIVNLVNSLSTYPSIYSVWYLFYMIFYIDFFYSIHFTVFPFLVSTVGGLKQCQNLILYFSSYFKRIWSTYIFF